MAKKHKCKACNGPMISCVCRDGLIISVCTKVKAEIKYKPLPRASIYCKEVK